MALTTRPEVIGSLLRLAESPDWLPRYNVAPTQLIPIVEESSAPGRRVLRLVRWGLIPFWARSADDAARTINARAETVHAKPTYREAFKKRRCVIPATGFYEWRAIPGQKRKQPVFVQRGDGAPMLFAGVWDRWRSPDGKTIDSAAVLTTAANALLAPIHDRMPVVLTPAEVDRWLDPHMPDPTGLSPMLGPREWPEVVVNEVGPGVNRPGFDDPSCIESASGRGEPGMLF